MTISSLDSSPGSRKFSFASPVQETLRRDTSLDISMILDDEKDQTRQDETDVHNDGQKDNVDEDKVDSLNEYIDVNVGEYSDDNLEGFREENHDKHGDVEEEKEPGKDSIPEPPPQPPLYRPPRPPIKLSFLGTTSFERRTGVRNPMHFIFENDRYDRSVFNRISILSPDLWTNGKILEHSVRDLRNILELKKRSYY